ncbi:hypothetical protein [Ammoniphilus sp. CFH 90114]|nr:hypothetical protein [Ammoniphilus sp. CFH 90114]
MKKWMIGLFLFGLLILGQVQATDQFAHDIPETLQPESLPPKH